MMPISRPDAIPWVGQFFWNRDVKSVLDLGVGYGLWGALFRAWTDIRMSEIKPDRYDYSETLIHGVEIFEEYKSPLWEIYDHVYISDALPWLQYSCQEKYDHIHIGDMIEHLEKDVGKALINACRLRLNPSGWLTVATTLGYRPQGAVLGNEHERHVCGWSMEEFRDHACHHTYVVGSSLVAAWPPAPLNAAALSDP